MKKVVLTWNKSVDFRGGRNRYKNSTNAFDEKNRVFQKFVKGVELTLDKFGHFRGVRIDWVQIRAF